MCRKQTVTADSARDSAPMVCVRTCKVFNGECQPPARHRGAYVAPVYVVVGMAGRVRQTQAGKPGKQTDRGETEPLGINSLQVREFEVL